MADDRRYLNRRDGAAYLGVSLRKLDMWLADRRIRVVRAGRRVLLDKLDLDKFFASLKTKTAATTVERRGRK